MEYTDAHTHLNSDELYRERNSHLHDFIACGWVGLVNVWVDAIWNARGIEIAEQRASQDGSCIVKATVWGHPSEVSHGNICNKDAIDTYIGGLCVLVEKHRDVIVAIGECGMDAHYPWYTNEIRLLQQDFFRRQCELARQYDLPVVIHSRDAFASMYEVLEAFSDLSVYVHCRWYGPDEAKVMIARFPRLRFWFCGNLSYPKAQLLRDSFQVVVTHEKYIRGKLGLLMETDAPWLSPQARRGKRHAPKYISEQYSYASELATMSGEDFSERVLLDWKRLYSM